MTDADKLLDVTYRHRLWSMNLTNQELLVRLFELAKETGYGARPHSVVERELRTVEEEVDRFWGEGTCDRLSEELTRTHANPDDAIEWARDRWGELETFLES